MNKPFILALLLTTMSSTSFARDSLITGEIEHGGFAGLSTGVTHINGDMESTFGIRGAWLVNHQFFLGFAGYGTVNSVTVDDKHFNYGGIWLGYLAHPNRIVHFSFDTVIGGAALESDGESGQSNDDDMFMIQPGISVGIALASFAELTAGVAYRFIENSDYPQFSNEDLSGMSAEIAFSFGLF